PRHGAARRTGCHARGGAAAPTTGAAATPAARSPAARHTAQTTRPPGGSHSRTAQCGSPPPPPAPGTVHPTGAHSHKRPPRTSEHLVVLGSIARWPSHVDPHPPAKLKAKLRTRVPAG